MARKRPTRQRAERTDGARVSSPVDVLLLDALQRGNETLETGRYLITFKEGAGEEGVQSIGVDALGMRVADARDFENQAVTFENVGDADAVVFPEIGVALVGAAAAQERGMSANAEFASEIAATHQAKPRATMRMPTQRRSAIWRSYGRSSTPGTSSTPASAR